jgi:hypothetical protein
VRGKSVVGAEISGPALPRFTSGVAAARLVESSGLCNRHHTGNAIKFSSRRSTCPEPCAGHFILVCIAVRV